MSLRRMGFALLGLLLVAPVLWGALRHVRAGEALALLRDSCTAHERVSFRGEAAWRRPRWNPPVQIRHDAESGRTSYRWHRRWSFTASRPNPRMPDPTAWCLDFDSVAEGYRAEERTTTRFLDRETRLLVLKPRREGRPTIHLTVDVETRLPLKVVVFRSDGSLYRVAAFRKIEIGPQEVKPSRRRFKWRGTPIPPEEAEG
ncbi:MAG: sigma-E factor regulatory protein RseB domain-containing protein, partial [Planctomycetota bacterium]